jgi:hypothetical protein
MKPAPLSMEGKNMRLLSFGRRTCALAAASAGLILLLLSAQPASSQGCVRAQYLPAGLVSEGLYYLEPRQWDVFVAYRYLYSDTAFTGGQEVNAPVPKTTIHSIDLGVTYAITRRFSATLILPFTDAQSRLVQGDRQFHSMYAAGPGDLRLLANAWLLDPAKHSTGNIAVSLGVKAPTGDYSASDNFHTMAGDVIQRPLLPNVQPGDGGWGIDTEVQGFLQLFKDTFAYAGGTYLSNPREKNGTEFTYPLLPPVYNSVPDQYMARVGLQYTIWPEKGLALSLGARFEGVPVHDLIGGSQGFRVAGYALSVEPGVSWTGKRNALRLSTPVAVLRHDQDSVYNQETHTKGTGAFADFLIMMSFDHRF